MGAKKLKRTSNQEQANSLANKALECHKNGFLDQADAFYQQALQIDRQNFDALHFLGLLRHQQGKNNVAESLIRSALKIRPSSSHAHYNLGVVLQALGKYREAILEYKKTIELDAKYALAYNNMGTIYRHLESNDTAIEYYEHAVKADPNCAQALSNLGAALNRGKRDIVKAVELCEKAVAINPVLPEAYVALAYSYGRQNRLKEALDALRRAIELNPSLSSEHSTLAMNIQYLGDLTKEQIFQEHLRWDQLHGKQNYNSALTLQNDLVPEKRLRIGYISGDFYYHSVSFFFEPLLEVRDKNNFEVYCYYNSKKADYITERFQKSADVWRDITTCSVDELVNMVREDRIDILIDLSGHTPSNCLVAFSHRMAPIQMTYIGYPNTTGLKAMDYRVTDKWADPVGITDQLHTEQLIRLNGGFLCYRPNDFAPETKEPPFKRNGFVTFGSFNNFCKISDANVRIWSKILNSVPGSKLLLKYKNIDKNGVDEDFVKRFGVHGISPDRLLFHGHVDSVEQHLRMYGQVDIALDTFPYCGTTTTCEAMWMGVPVVTLAGDAHVSRVGVSLLTNVGMPQLIANTEEEYVALATVLASRQRDLISLRQQLRPLMDKSNLTNKNLLVRSLEQAFRAVWVHYCQTHK